MRGGMRDIGTLAGFSTYSTSRRSRLCYAMLLHARLGYETTGCSAALSQAKPDGGLFFFSLSSSSFPFFLLSFLDF